MGCGNGSKPTDPQATPTGARRSAATSAVRGADLRASGALASELVVRRRKKIEGNHPQILRGSFSAVSTATIARIGAFFRIFRDLQDLHSFAPLRPQNFRKKLVRNFVGMKHFHFHSHSIKNR